MKKIVVASDSFKGSATSLQVAEAVARGVRRVLPECEVVAVPVADGGEGTAEALVRASGGCMVEARAHDPLMRPIGCRYGMIEGGATAVIDMATASGLTLLAPGERDPMAATSYGTGELIADAIERGCRHVVVGVGGTATCDGGTGIMRALGYVFTDVHGREVAQGGGALHAIAGIRPPSANIADGVRFTVLCDVTNPFYGPEGAAFVFAPQKGATPEEVKLLDKGLRNLARVVAEYNGREIGQLAGSGAGGGAAGMFHALCNGRIERGIEYVLDSAGFEQALEGADFVITGEGHMDGQTLRGKAPAGVLDTAKRRGVPVIAITGGVSDRRTLLAAGFFAIFSIHHHTPTEAEKSDTALTLRLIEEEIYDLFVPA